MSRVALVTGGNRGIGFEVCRALARDGMTVLLGSRNPSLGRGAVDELVAEGLDVRLEILDVAIEESVAALADRLAAKQTAVDVLVNNAGVLHEPALLDLPTDSFLEALQINLLGAFRPARAFLPGMIRRGHGRVVQVSSGYGSFAEGLQGPPVYAVTKAALNALTVKLAAEVPVGADVKVNAACPGWVRTRMGGHEAMRSPEEGAAEIVRLATLPEDGPTGGLFRDGAPVPW